ncbi:MAG: MBL fold metallo-hydrolase [Clostridia bacterium]|nr:MBL fold metallo-hydrolase [Clostridia bacterium]
MNIKNIIKENLTYTIDLGKGGVAYSYTGISRHSFIDACNLISENRYERKSNYMIANNEVREFVCGDDYIIAMHYPHMQEMQIVTEKNSPFPSYKNIMTDFRCKSSITQIALEDFGLSYVIKLGDGRFIIIDGGWEFEIEADKIMNCLNEQSPFEKPIIAAWIMTHPHLDHYRCFMPFVQKYADNVVIESLIYSFPDTNNEQPILQKLFECEAKEKEHILRFGNKVAEMGIPTYVPHTGQIYNISNAHIEILSAPEDMFYEEIDDYNKISLIFKMTLEGQTVLWCGDAYYKQARLALRWGGYLKSDILQVPHHGFCGGEPEEYDIINPDVCMWTVSQEDGYVRIDEYQPNSHYLMHNVDVKEHICSDDNVVLPMPYTPNPNGKKIHNDKMEKAQKSIGATSWFFDDMSKEECKFTFMCSLSSSNIEVYADLYFKQPKDFVQNIKITLKPFCLNKIDLFNPEDADPHAMYFDRSTLKVKGMPENERFGIHFKSDKPFVVSGCKKEVYHD